MRKQIYLASAAIVATMLISCNKFEDSIKTTNDSTIKVELNATTGTPDTKVTVGAKDGNKYPVTWDAEGESIIVREVSKSPNGTKTKTSTTYTLSEDKKTAKFIYELDKKEAESFDYHFISPASSDANFDSGKFTLKLASNQKSGVNSPDPASVILYANCLNQSSQQETVNANFKALSAVGKMTVKNLNIGTEETLLSIKVQAEGKDLSATTVFTYEDGKFTHHKSAMDNINVDVSGINTSGDFCFWFNCWPCTFEPGDKLVVIASTDETTYTSEFTLTKKQELKAATVNELSVDMASAIRPAFKETFTLTTIDKIAADEDVVITMKIGDKYYALTNDKGTSTAPPAIEVSVNENAIINPGAFLKWNITESSGKYIIHPVGDAAKCLYTTDGNNGVRVGSTSGSWVFDSDKDGDYLKYSTLTRFLGVYSSSSPSDWRTYTSKTAANISGQNVKFFSFKDPRDAQNLTFPQDSYEVELGSTFNAPTVSGAQTEVRYSSDNTEVATVNENTGAVTIKAEGTVNITASAAESKDYKSGSASYKIAVISSTVLSTIDEIFTAAKSEEVKIKVKFNDWVVSAVKGDNAYVTDGSKGFVIYTKNHGFEANEMLRGTVTCGLKLYNGAAQIMGITTSSEGLSVLASEGDITAKNMSIADLSGVNTGAYIDLGTLTYNGSTFSDGTNTIKPYNAFTTLPSLSKDMKYNVKGIYIQYNETKEIAPLSAADIEEASVEKYTITIDNTIQHGSVTTTPATEAAAGVSVKLTATPENGYKFKEWNVTKTESGEVITVSGNTFTMPAEAVTVSASFEQKGEEIIVWKDDFSNSKQCSSTALTELKGSVAPFTGKYTISKVYPMEGAVKIGSTSAKGVLTTPALTGISGTKLLTITVVAAGWNGKSAKLTVSASTGTTTEEETAIESESTMAGNSPTMTGKSYVFHVNGADNTTTISLTSNLAIGVSELTIVAE